MDRLAGARGPWRAAPTARGTEFGIFAVTSAAVMLTTHSVMAILAVGDLVRDSGRRAGVGRFRRANLLDMTVCTYPFLLPFFIPTILAASATASGEAFGVPRVSALEAGLANAYSWALLAMILVAITTGLGRSEDRKRCDHAVTPTAWNAGFSRHSPPEAGGVAVGSLARWRGRKDPQPPGRQDGAPAWNAGLQTGTRRAPRGACRTPQCQEGARFGPHPDLDVAHHPPRRNGVQSPGETPMMFQHGAPRRVALLGLVLAVCLFGCGPPDYDLLIQGGTVFDGTGTPGVVTDLAIKGERIAAIGDVGGSAERTIDATGLYVAPGFVDMHSHSELRRLLDGGQGPSFAFQGLTTEVYGETTSMGPRGGRIEGALPEELEGKWETLGGFLDYLDETGIAINVASYVGSGSVRAYVMGYEDREPTGEELEQMLGLVRDAMAEGAFGVSAGMSYVPNIYMSTEELAAIVAEAAVGGRHLREPRPHHERDRSGGDHRGPPHRRTGGRAGPLLPPELDLLHRGGHLPRPH